MTASIATATDAPAIHPAVEFPNDPGLPDLSNLFDPDWVWSAYQAKFGYLSPQPVNIRVRQFSHSTGRTALISYLLEWGPDEYIPSQHISIKTVAGKPTELHRYPEDDRLPGLQQSAEPESALSLVNEHVLNFRARQIRVQLVRYRPSSRAVFRHIVGRVRLYARAMRPNDVPALLAGSELVAQSSFIVPRIVGHWRDGAVVWMSEIPGKNLRNRIGKGRIPDPTPILEGLDTLWRTPEQNSTAQPFNLARAYYTARRTFKHKVHDNHNAAQQLRRAVERLDPFVKSWRPSSIAHNDFYDDQVLQLPDGRVALVDLEDAGPGDPMLDVGNCLAHSKWASHFGSKRRSDANSKFYGAFRTSALEKFRWDPNQLAMREAVCLFRVCTNAIRHPKPDWQNTLERGLELVNQTLD